MKLIDEVYMTDQELFFKYNLCDTKDISKEETLRRINNRTAYKDIYDSNTRKHFLVLLHATYACNANCVYCENHRLREKYGNKLISKEILRQVVEKLGPRINELTWHGGETLLVPEDYFSFVESIKKEKGFKFNTNLQTNSILLDDKKIEFLRQLGIDWGTSFDGMYNTESRGQKSTDAIFRLLDEYKLNFGFIGVTYSKSIDNLINNYEWLKEKGFTSMQCCIVRENVIDNTNPYLIPNDVAIPKMLEYIDYWIHDVNNPIYDSYVVRQIERVLGHVHLCEDVNCVGGWLIVDPDGNIGFCGHSADDGTICNIQDIKSADDLISSRKYLSTIGKQMKLVKSCKGCKWYHVCHGGCMGINYEQDNEYHTVNTRNCEYNTLLLDGVYEQIKDVDIQCEDKYNPLFIETLKRNNYFSLTEIKELEKI